MKRRSINWAILPALLSLTVAAAPAKAATPPGFKVYTSTLQHYRVAYPASWTERSVSYDTFFTGPTVGGVTTSVVILALPLPSSVTVDQLAASFARKSRSEGRKFLGKSKIEVAGTSGWLLKAQLLPPDTGLMDTVMFGHGGKAWTITYHASPAGHGQSWGLFQKMVASFAFTS